MANQTKTDFDIEHARDHLANERTFLAWIRTSLGIIGFGFIIVKFSFFINEIETFLQKRFHFSQSPYSYIIGITLILLGSLLTVVAFIRYKQTQKMIYSNKFSQTSWPLGFITVLLVLCGAILIFYLITLR